MSFTAAPTSNQSNNQSNSIRNVEEYVVGGKFASRRDYDQDNQLVDDTKDSRLQGTAELVRLRELSNDFAELLNRRDLSDCWLNVNGTYMAVHQCVLAARSNAFASAISDYMRDNDTSNADPSTKLRMRDENNRAVIEIKRFRPEIMKLAIIFMYTGYCNISEHTALEILEVAGAYDIKSLKVHAAHYLVNVVSIQNFTSLFESSSKYENEWLRQKCIEYFIENAKDIMDKNPKWKQFADANPTLLSELLYWNVHRDEFFQRMSN